MNFSVVVPALNEEKSVGKVIKTLRKQRVEKDSFEIIVVNNNSDDRTAEVARRAGADKVVFEKKMGTNLARQKGVSVSRGEIIAFIDADCIAPPEWLGNIKKAIFRKGVVAVSGPYKYGKFLPDFMMWRVFPLVPKLMSFVTGKRGGVILGGNFAAYRSAIDKIGGLPPIKFFGDDTAIAILLARRAGKVLYTRKVWVESSPRRLREKGVVKVSVKYFRHYFKIYFDNEYQ